MSPGAGHGRPTSPAPAALGFRMPAEWEPHVGTWLSWPHNRDSWPGHFEPIPGVWVEIVRALQPYERVHILVNDEQSRAAVRKLLGVGRQENVFFHIVPTNDAWMRDHGPTFVTRQRQGRTELAIVDWVFNAWGGKYPPWDRDDAVPQQLAQLLGAPSFAADFVLEGGSIDVNGHGAVLTTESCLLNPNRNPGLDREQIEKRLRSYLGITHVLWLGDGIAGDDTDGHVDDLARFVSPTHVVTALEEDPRDENYHALRENYERLLRMTDQDGRPLSVSTLPMPRPVLHEGNRLPASYANFYIANGAVLVPVFDDPNDATALLTIGELFPSRQVMGIPARDMVWGLGAVHCVTQQQPLGEAVDV